MATATYRQKGDSIDYTPGSDVSAGDVVVLNDLVSVVKLDIPANKQGALAVVGVYDFPKATGGGSAISMGKKVYWDVGDQQAKEDDESGANKLIGKVAKSATDDDTIVSVRLSQ